MKSNKKILVEINRDAIQKSLDFFNIKGVEINEDLFKSNTPTPLSSNPFIKSTSFKEENHNDLSIKKEEALNTLKKAQDLLSVIPKIEKDFRDLEKANKDLFEKINSIESSFKRKEDNLLRKAEEDKKVIEDLKGRLQKIEDSPNPRKSITSIPLNKEGFDEGNNIKKGGETTLSISRNKQALSDILLSKSGANSGTITDQEYANAVETLSWGNQISQSVMMKLANDGIKVIP